MAFCQSPSKAHDDNYSPTVALVILSQTTSPSTLADKDCFISFMGFHGQSSMALYGDVLKKSLTLDIRMSSRAAALSAGEIPLPAITEAHASWVWPFPHTPLLLELWKLHCLLQMPAWRDVRNTECLSISSCGVWLSGTFFPCWIVTMLSGKQLEPSPQWLPSPAQCQVRPDCPIETWLGTSQAP